MHFPSSYFSVVLVGFSALVSALPSPPTVRNGDGTPVKPPKDKRLASFEGLTHNVWDRSGREMDQPEKYFHESTFDSHYDGRFANTMLPSSERNIHLRALVRTYLATMHSLRAETWIMHGTLLGWWWNQRIMPWDTDIDVQVSEAAMAYLASWYNMTMHTFRDAPSIGDELAPLVAAGGKLGARGKKYLLEINPNWANPSTEDSLNVIDARWIDIDTGLFIDITAVRLNHSVSPDEPQQLYCKDKHHYRADDIFPLRPSVFEGVPVQVPYAYQDLLAEEYGADALVNTHFYKQNHFFDQAAMEWRPMTNEQLGLLQLKGSVVPPEGGTKEDVATQPAKGFERFAPHRAARPSRVEKVEAGEMVSGREGEVHHPPGSVNDF